MTKFTVQVTTEIVVDLDENKFTEDFVNEYNDNFSYMGDHGDPDMLEAHAKQIAFLVASGMWNDRFVEGYGPPDEMNITVEHEEHYDTEVLQTEDAD